MTRPEGLCHQRDQRQNWTHEFKWALALHAGPLRVHIQGRKEKLFLTTETIPVVTELHLFSDVTGQWYREPDTESQGNHCTCPPAEGRLIADKDVSYNQYKHGSLFFELQGDGILGWEINTSIQSWAVPVDWVTWALQGLSSTLTPSP